MTAAEPTSEPNPPASGEKGLEIVFVCQAIDRDDPVNATTARWVAALARNSQVHHVTVLALRIGRYDLPPNVDVHGFGRRTRFGTLADFYRGVAEAVRRKPDWFFIHQGGPYPVLLLPFKLLHRIPIIQWKAHPVISRVMNFYARWCDDLIVTSARAAFPIDSPKVRVVGQGVDTDVFGIQDRPHLGDVVAVCRIAPSKRVAEMVTAVMHANRRFGKHYTFNIYGPALPGDERYADSLRQLIDRLDGSGLIRLHGPVTQSELPRILNGHRAFLNFSTTAIDRSVVEAMACGVPVVSTNDSIREITPFELRPVIITDKWSAAEQATAIHDLLERPSEEADALGRRLRNLVVTEHGIDRLFDRILEEARGLGDRRR